MSVYPINPETKYNLELWGLTDASSEKNRMEKFKAGFIDKPLAFQLDFNSSQIPEKNNVSILENGVSGAAAYFDGMDDYIYIPSNEDTNFSGNMAVSLWFRIENPESDEYMRLLSNRKTWDENAGYELEINPLRTRINFCGGATNPDEQGVTEYSFDDDWHHLVAMIKDKKAVFYVNGEHIGKDSFVAEPLPTETGLYIGCSGSENDFFQGWLDEINLFRRALSEMEIEKLYNLKQNENRE
jgi:hypothetical protein